jgi:hypothetical protein
MPRIAGAGAGAGFLGFGDVFSDIFGEIFGGGRTGRSSVFRGADLRYNLEIALEQAAKGFETRIRIPTMGECTHVPRQRREARHAAADLHDVPRQRPGARVAGTVLDRADLPALPRLRQDGHEPVHGVRGRGSRQAPEDAAGADSVRRR